MRLAAIAIVPALWAVSLTLLDAATPFRTRPPLTFAPSLSVSAKRHAAFCSASGFKGRPALGARIEEIREHSSFIIPSLSSCPRYRMGLCSFPSNRSVRRTAIALDAQAISVEGLSLYNTLAREKQPFISLEEGSVKMYTCGPTVYDYAHIGNFRAFLTYDLIKRWLLYCGYDVDHVCNLTDIDDKIIQRMQVGI